MHPNIIRENIQHHVRENFSKNFLQATSVTIKNDWYPLTITSAYCPPRHSNKKEQYEQFFKTLGNNSIAGGDYSAKHSRRGYA